jgi:hypothetical protein
MVIFHGYGHNQMVNHKDQSPKFSQPPLPTKKKNGRQVLQYLTTVVLPKLPAQAVELTVLLQAKVDLVAELRWMATLRWVKRDG